MSKILVVYASKTGCTQGVAEEIGKTLVDLGAEVDVEPATLGLDAAAYDAVVVGSGVRAGSWHGSAMKWVTANAETLRRIPTAFYTTGLTIATEPEKAEEVRSYTDKLIEESGVSPVDVGLFAGINEPEKFSLPERLILKALKAPQGDFRDYEKIAAWSREVAGKLGAA